MVTFDEEDVQTLVELGLNRSQAKTYLTLVSLGVAEAKKIAQIASIDRGEAYRQLDILQEKSLVEKVLGVPIAYKPIALNEALDILLQRKSRETCEIQQKAEALSEKGRFGEALSEKGFRISVVPKSEYLVHYVTGFIDLAEKEIIWYTQVERIPLTLTHYSEAHKKAMVKGIRYRIIAELSKPTDQILKFIGEYTKRNPNFAIRFAKTELLVTFAIRDGIEMDFFTEPAGGLANSPALCTNNPQLIKVLTDYFELRWAAAMTEYPKE